MLIEIHMIQHHSPANLNRDDLGAPKTCMFGGGPRARISSQCIKRSIRNPGNAEETHNREPGMFAQAMEDYIGLRTKFFPWLVKKVLDEPDMTRRLTDNSNEVEIENTKKAIVAACRTIARSEGKAPGKKEEKQKKDKRPQTPQLIYLGPTQARDFVDALLTLRDDAKTADCYQYFLDPATVFESLLEPELVETTLSEEQREKVLKGGWRIRNTESRLTKLRELLRTSADSDESLGDSETGTNADEQVPPDDGQIAKEIALGLELLAQTDEKEFAKIVSPKVAKGEPKLQPKRDKPTHYDDYFVEPLKRATFKVSADIALFGRMTTSDYIADIEAAMQVAHAISTHEVATEVDYWTAVDDLGSTQASGHLGEAMFDSACFYKYFSLDWDQLVHNVGPEPKKPKDKKAGDPEMLKWQEAHQKWRNEVKPQGERLAACTLGHFIRAAAWTNSGGKQNSFASHCRPSGILVEIKDTKIPTSYANAFAEPARRIGEPPDDAADCVSLVGRSIAQFGDHVYNVRKAYGITSTLLWHALPLYRYPLQGWQREDDGRKKKDDKGKELPPLPFTEWDASANQHCKLGHLGGEEGKPEGLVEAVIEALGLGLKWNDVKDLGKASPKEF